MRRRMEKHTTRSVKTIHRRWVAPALVLAMGFALGAGPAAGQADPNAAAVKDLLGASTSLGLDWGKLFDENGKAKDEVDAAGAPGFNRVPDYIDWYGGIDGAAIEDNISNGVAVDMSAVVGGPSISTCTVVNSTVSADNDLGNSYMYATFDSLDNLVVYLGVERLAASGDTSLEIELNQDRVRVASGVPWPVWGGRTENDLLLRADYTAGVVSSVAVSRWVGDDETGSFQQVALYGGLDSSACNGEAGYCLFCSGAAPIAAPQDVWDMSGAAIAATAPSDFLEIGVNVGNLLGMFVDYTAIQVRTPEDIALGSFLAIGSWSN